MIEKFERLERFDNCSRLWLTEADIYGARADEPNGYFYDVMGDDVRDELLYQLEAKTVEDLVGLQVVIDAQSDDDDERPRTVTFFRWEYIPRAVNHARSGAFRIEEVRVFEGEEDDGYGPMLVLTEAAHDGSAHPDAFVGAWSHRVGDDVSGLLSTLGVGGLDDLVGNVVDVTVAKGTDRPVSFAPWGPVAAG